jgi:SNF2 family DNA or RNA helicase
MALKSFWDDPDCKIFLSTEAGGLGVNLQCASIVINYEVHWNPARLRQRIGRLHRIGQKDTVTCINLVAENTIEERVLRVVNEKTDLFRKVVDGDFGDPSHERGFLRVLDLEFGGDAA